MDSLLGSDEQLSDVLHHVVRENIEENKINLENTLEMVANINFKPLPKPRLEELRSLMGLFKVWVEWGFVNQVIFC